jgi:hypothetical protein
MIDHTEFQKVLIPFIRRIVPNLIAAEIVGVQPMYGVLKMYSVLESAVVDGVTMYSITADAKVLTWIRATFVEDKDYFIVRQVKGVWYDVSEEVMTLLKLKWA